MEKSNLEPVTTPPNLEQLFSLVQSLEKSIAQQKEEFIEQKQQLESKITHLEKALKEKANLVPEAQPVTQEVTSRRRMLKKLGGAAAGMAAATTLMVATNTQSAQAVGGLVFQGAPGDPNVVASTTKIISGPAPGAYSNTSILELSITNPSPGGVVDGIQSSSALGVGLIGQSNLATKAGVIGTNGNLTPTGLASGVTSSDIGAVSGGSDSGSGRGVTGYVTGGVAAVGVLGKATGSGGIGVLGTSTSGLGGSFATGISSKRGQVLLQAGGSAPDGTWTSNALGEMYVDSAGRFYIYENSAGTGAAWKLFGTSNPSGVIKLLTKPSRFVDTRSFVKRNDAAGPYTDGVERTYNFLAISGFGGVTIPPNATGLVGNITCVATSAGFLQVSPTTLDHVNDPSTLNFTPGAGTANAFISNLNAGNLKVFCRLYSPVGTNAEIIIDIVGYLL